VSRHEDRADRHGDDGRALGARDFPALGARDFPALGARDFPAVDVAR